MKILSLIIIAWSLKVLGYQESQEVQQSSNKVASYKTFLHNYQHNSRTQAFDLSRLSAFYNTDIL